MKYICDSLVSLLQMNFIWRFMTFVFITIYRVGIIFQESGINSRIYHTAVSCIVNWIQWHSVPVVFRVLMGYGNRSPSLESIVNLWGLSNSHPRLCPCPLLPPNTFLTSSHFLIRRSMEAVADLLTWTFYTSFRRTLTGWTRLSASQWSIVHIRIVILRTHLFRRNSPISDKYVRPSLYVNTILCQYSLCRRRKNVLTPHAHCYEITGIVFWNFSRSLYFT